MKATGPISRLASSPWSCERPKVKRQRSKSKRSGAKTAMVVIAIKFSAVATAEDSVNGAKDKQLNQSTRKAPASYQIRQEQCMPKTARHDNFADARVPKSCAMHVFPGANALP